MSNQTDTVNVSKNNAVLIKNGIGQPRYGGSDLQNARHSQDRPSPDEYMMAQEHYSKIEIAKRPSNKSSQEISMASFSEKQPIQPATSLLLSKQ